MLEDNIKMNFKKEDGLVRTAISVSLLWTRYWPSRIWTVLSQNHWVRGLCSFVQWSRLVLSKRPNRGGVSLPSPEDVSGPWTEPTNPDTPSVRTLSLWSCSWSPTIRHQCDARANQRGQTRFCLVFSGFPLKQLLINYHAAIKAAKQSKLNHSIIDIQAECNSRQYVWIHLPFLCPM
jgi:hypothetical protein